MGERRGTRGLELWCKRMTEGYPGVKVENMTTSWRDGLAFCAIIHHFRPDLIDFTKLNKNDIYNNNNLAFRIAEDHLGIPALLEPEDMVEYPVPDRLSILTYLSQFYQVFAVNSSSPTKLPSKRPPPADLQRHMVAATGSSPPKKAAFGVLGARREPCTKCALPVFIAERLNVGKALYHRTCFRCARCDSQLTLANYYETENGEFCCETCPDEEKPTTSHETNILSRSLSDEEKSASLKEDSGPLKGESDPYSANFENVLEDPYDNSLKRNFTLDRMLGTQFIKARTDFMTTQMVYSSSDSEIDSEDKPPDLPVSQKPQLEENANEHSENIDVFSNNLLPSLSDNISVNSDQHSPDQQSCETQDSVTKDSISPSIRSRMKMFETNVEVRVKSDVNKEPLSISDNYVEVPQLKTPDGTGEKTEQSYSDVSDVSIHADQEEVVKETPLKDFTTSPLEDSKHISADIGIHSDSSKTSEMDEIIILPSETSDSPLGSSSVPSHEPREVSEEHSVVIISDSDDSRCQPDISPCDDSKDSIENSEQPVKVEYPDDLNPFGDEQETEETTRLSETAQIKQETVKPLPGASLNPFGDTDEEEEEGTEKTPIPAPRLIAAPKSLNPFGSDEDEENEDASSSLPPQPALRKLKAPRISLSPFWQEDDSPAQGNKSFSTPPKSRSDTTSLTGSGRKKKPAPKPPSSSLFQEVNDSPFSSLNSSPSQSLCHLNNVPARPRKMRRAPLPPASTPRNKVFESSEPAYSPIDEKIKTEEMKPLQFKTGSEENLKTNKDEVNKNIQDTNSISEGPSSLPNKSTYGKWKRRKGQAPARPIPQKRTIKRLPLNEIKHELEVIEIQQQGLEKQGVTLEKIIRERSETPGTNTDDNLPPEIEDMILQLFELVNEKNELFRKQTELMYLRRQYRLEEEHAEIEYQIRCLMLQPDAYKTDSDKAKEEELLNRMIEIVERRNEIVDCLEMERRREAEEDSSIRNQLNIYSMKRGNEDSASKKTTKKDKNKHKKDKEKKNRKNKADIDESPKLAQKEKKKKKMLGLF